ncbi:MAG: hypothetical protein HOI95_11990 [Chromatiales bacterium]|jgi:hypothetical protein|nr:hypothetical protein [Chromatiales bacterium]
MKNKLTLSITLQEKYIDRVFPFLHHLVDDDWKSARTQARIISDATFEGFNSNLPLFRDELRTTALIERAGWDDAGFQFELGRRRLRAKRRANGNPGAVLCGPALVTARASATEGLELDRNPVRVDSGDLPGGGDR